MNPSELDGKHRREQILGQACRMFAEHGVRGTSMRALARACNCNEALLYKHFPSKEALFTEVIGSIQSGIRDHWLEISSVATSGLEALKGIVKSIHDAPTGEDHVYGNPVHCMASLMRNPDLKPLLASGLTEQVEMLMSLVIRGVEDGSVLRKGDPVNCAWCILVRSFALSAVDSLMPEEFNTIPRHGNPVEVVLGCLTDGVGPGKDESDR